MKHRVRQKNQAASVFTLTLLIFNSTLPENTDWSRSVLISLSDGYQKEETSNMSAATQTGNNRLDRFRVSAGTEWSVFIPWIFRFELLHVCTEYHLPRGKITEEAAVLMRSAENPSSPMVTARTGFFIRNEASNLGLRIFLLPVGHFCRCVPVTQPRGSSVLPSQHCLLSGSYLAVLAPMPCDCGFLPACASLYKKPPAQPPSCPGHSHKRSLLNNKFPVQPLIFSLCPSVWYHFRTCVFGGY